MKNFLRENLMIVVSIALPLLVVIFFALASVLPGLYSTPPAYDLLLSLQDKSTAKTSPVKISLVVEAEKLKALVVKLDNPGYEQNPRLFRYDHLSGEVVEVSIPLPANIIDMNAGFEIPIPGFAQLRISDALRAPDGYEFRGRRRGGGLMTELFGGSRNRTDVSISKNGAIIRINLPASDYWYNDVRLVGWVID
jgi:hypothetical protein